MKNTPKLKRLLGKNEEEAIRLINSLILRLEQLRKEAEDIKIKNK